ncbi:hypothetical protein NDU88_012209 [Pleurodeles waltl]|uniref:Transposase n=1 Tax=Pleurodeles waltl TaxID=8319 RepID=A0AAV7QZH1_PLEWA|nr:hypothetical protein NDU88_012209 [Pleurodeles waltl]
MEPGVSGPVSHHMPESDATWHTAFRRFGILCSKSGTAARLTPFFSYTALLGSAEICRSPVARTTPSGRLHCSGPLSNAMPPQV